MSRTRLDVTDALRDFAKQYGAYLDETNGYWYVDGEVPLELEELAVRRGGRSYESGLAQGVNFALRGMLDSTRFEPVEKKPLPADLLQRIEEITGLVSRLLPHPNVAMRWLNTPMITLGKLAPLQVMVDLNGCDQVESLLRQTFQYQLESENIESGSA